MFEPIRYGLTSFSTITRLRENRSLLPKAPGVYMVVCPNDYNPVFTATTTGPTEHRGRSLVRSVDLLKNKWVNGACVLYIGKADNLYERTGDYMEYGHNKFKSHRGGRNIWQLADSDNLLVYWKETPLESPFSVESSLLNDFLRIYGVLPFANMIRGRE